MVISPGNIPATILNKSALHFMQGAGHRPRHIIKVDCVVVGRIDHDSIREWMQAERGEEENLMRSSTSVHIGLSLPAECFESAGRKREHGGSLSSGSQLASSKDMGEGRDSKSRRSLFIPGVD